MLRKIAALRDYIVLPSPRQLFTIVLVVLIVVLFELIEHNIVSWANWLENDIIRDLLFYGALTALATGHIIIRVERLSIAYQQSNIAYDNLQILLDQLSNAQDDQEASAIYLQALRTNLPFSGVQLMIYDPVDAKFNFLAGWPHNSAEFFQHKPQCGQQACIFQTGNKDNHLGLTPAACADNVQNSSWPYLYCYPLSGNDRQAGLLYLYHVEEIQLKDAQIKMLHVMSAEFVATLERIEIQQSLVRHLSSEASIQQRIARDMHVTLGHNLAYLRMKLAQLVDYRINDSYLSNEFIQLSNTANEAYHQMRDLLVALAPEKTPNLRSTMAKYAQRIASRARFELKIQQTGEVMPLNPVLLQQIILILREALGNIEKHARATLVNIAMSWKENGLGIQVIDNGYGFDVSRSPTDEQFGLRFMQERTKEVNGELKINSTIGSGTTISLWIPYP